MKIDFNKIQSIGWFVFAFLVFLSVENLANDVKSLLIILTLGTFGFGMSYLNFIYYEAKEECE